MQLHLNLVQHLFKRAHVYVHLTYLALVYVESHGLYGIAAGALGMVVIGGDVIDKAINKRELS